MGPHLLLAPDWGRLMLYETMFQYRARVRRAFRRVGVPQRSLQAASRAASRQEIILDMAGFLEGGIPDTRPLRGQTQHPRF